jgi:ABC-type glycerol-3-phosphate transport system permease component
MTAANLPRDAAASPYSISGNARRRRRIPWRTLLLIFILGLGAIAMLVPFYWTLITSFKPRNEIATFPPTWWPQNPILTNWTGLANLNIGSFPVFFRNSLFVSTVITLVTLFTSSLTGYVFAKFQFRGRDKLFYVILSMMIIPFSITIIPSYALMVTFGWINSYWALVMPVAFNPFGIFLMRQFMFGIPNELLDAARIDGAGEWTIYWRIIVPLSASGLAALGILVFIGQWDNFLWPLVIINEARLYTLPLGLAQFRGRIGTDVGPLSAASMLSILPVLIVYMFAQRRFIEGIALSGLKG